MMYLTVVGRVLTLATGTSGSSSSPDTTLQTVSSIANIVYVGLTVIIVIVAIRSLALARNQMDESKRQSEAALAASEKQSQLAIDAVQEQIKASEKQSQAAIDAVQEQIKASEKQSQETMYNQFKPVIVPLTHPTSVLNNDTNYTMEMENKGAGVALNTWGIFYIKNFLLAVYHFNKRYVLVPDRKELIVFNDERDGIKAPSGDFYGHATFPGPMPRINDRGRSSGSFLMITYNDVFGNKYLVVFDYKDELGWEQVDLKKIERRLDELIEIKTYSSLS